MDSPSISSLSRSEVFRAIFNELVGSLGVRPKEVYLAQDRLLKMKIDLAVEL